MAFPNTINVNDALHGTVLTLRVTGVKRLRLRIWVGAKLMLLAAWIMGVGCEIDIQEPES